MRAGRLGRLAGLVLALAAVVVVSTVGSSEFTTFEYEWGLGATEGFIGFMTGN